MASCPFPLHAFPTGEKLPTGGDKYIFRSRFVNEVIYPVQVKIKRNKQFKNMKVNYNGKICDLDTKYTFTTKFVNLIDFIEIPCGTCEVCKANQARLKGERAMAEASMHVKNEVINLTYNNENMPRNKAGKPTLKYKDVQDFKKRLLKYWKQHYGAEGIKFLCASEYGENYGRPHYHMIMFNFETYDKYDWGESKKGSKQWRSPAIEKLWGKGHVTIGEVTPETIQYVANYCLKKFKGKQAKGYYEIMDIEPENVRGSNRNGLGSSFWGEHKETYEQHGKCFLGTFSGVKTIHVNSYFDELIEREKGKEYLKTIKNERRELMEKRELTRAKTTGVDIETQRQNDYRQFLDRIKSAKKRSFKEED